MGGLGNLGSLFQDPELLQAFQVYLHTYISQKPFVFKYCKVTDANDADELDIGLTGTYKIHVCTHTHTHNTHFAGSSLAASQTVDHV